MSAPVPNPFEAIFSDMLHIKEQLEKLKEQINGGSEIDGRLDLISAEQVVMVLGCKVGAARTLPIPRYKILKRIYYLKSDLADYVDRCRVHEVPSRINFTS